jgi:hypothetical protein
MNKEQVLANANREAFINEIATAKGVPAVAKQLATSHQVMVDAIAAHMYAQSKRDGYMTMPTMQKVATQLASAPLHNDVTMALRKLAGLS